MDENLWQKLKAGNENAFNILYEKYFASLFIYGNQLYGDEELVKDCIQNLFVELWNKRSQLSEVKFVKSYLFKSIRRKIYRALASRQKFVSGETACEKQDLEIVFSHEHLIITNQLSEEKVKKLQKYFDLLTPRQKEAIMLRFYENLSYNEIAGVMNLKEAKYARDLIYKAIDKLKRIISPNFIYSLYFFYSL